MLILWYSFARKGAKMAGETSKKILMPGRDSLPSVVGLTLEERSRRGWMQTSQQGPVYHPMGMDTLTARQKVASAVPQIPSER